MLWVLDLDGVVWLGGTPIPGAQEAVRRLHHAGEKVAFVTNNSGPTLSEYVARLGQAGIEAEPDELLTSAQAAASLLEPGSRAAVVGGPGVNEALAVRGVTVARSLAMSQALLPMPTMQTRLPTKGSGSL